MSIKKQAIINHLSVPTEIQDYIKGFIFFDKVASEAKRNKQRLLSNLKNSMFYVYDYDGHWAFSAEPQIQLQAINCRHCGEFIIANSLERGSNCRC